MVPNGNIVLSILRVNANTNVWWLMFAIIDEELIKGSFIILKNDWKHIGPEDLNEIFLDKFSNLLQ